MSNKLPLACDLSAIDENERLKHNQNGEFVFKKVRDISERSDGYSFRFPAETDIIERAGAFIARERLCCPFFHFSLEVTPGHGPVWLHLSGDENLKQFIADHVIPQLKTKEGKG